MIQVDPWFLERIDVIKGPSSALYGQTIPGGQVMETSEAPAVHRGEATSDAMYGNNSTTGLAFDYTNAINDEWAYRIIGMTKNTDTQYEYPRRTLCHFPSLLWQPDENTSLVLRVSGKRSVRRFPRFGSGGWRYSSTGRKISTGFSDVEPRVMTSSSATSRSTAMNLRTTLMTCGLLRSNASYTHSNVGLKQAYQLVGRMRSTTS